MLTVLVISYTSTHHGGTVHGCVETVRCIVMHFLQTLKGEECAGVCNSQIVQWHCTGYIHAYIPTSTLVSGGIAGT